MCQICFINRLVNMGFVSWTNWRSSSFFVRCQSDFSLKWQSSVFLTSFVHEWTAETSNASYFPSSQSYQHDVINSRNQCDIIYNDRDSLCITWGRETNQYLWNRKLNEHFSSHLVKAIFSYSFLCVDINQRLMHTCWKGPESKCFKLCELRRLCCKCFSLPLQYRSSQR